MRMPIVSIGLAALVLAAGIAPGQAADPYFKNKRVTMLINFAAGGPTDVEGRIFAKHIGKHIEGAPNVIVQNMDGAGGFIGAQYVGEIAPKDGTVVGLLTGTPWVYASDPDRWRVDFRHYEFIAYQPSTTVHFVRTDVPPGMKVPADIVKAKGLIIGGLSIDTSKDIRLRLALDMLGVPFQYVTGYRSSPPARLAMQRGEIHMFSESPPSYRSIVEPQMVKTGEAIPVFYDEVTDGSPVSKQLAGLTIPNFPQLYEQVKGKRPSGELWEAYRTLYELSSNLLRVIAVPPGTPPAALAALGNAVEALNHDPEFAAESMKLMEFVPEYVTGPGTSDKVRGMLVATPQMRDYLNTYMRNVPKR
jgi:tripartite-type tricarboxylate transporter receptor subunit TctC